MDHRTARLVAIAALVAALLLLVPYSLQQLGPDELLQPLLVALANHAAALGLGSALLHRALPDDLRRFTWGWPLGLFVFGLAQMALAWAGLFHPFAALGLWVVGGAGWLFSGRALISQLPRLKAGLRHPVAVLVLVALSLTLYRASVEPLFHDSLLYHLGVLTQMAARGAAVTEPHVTLAAMTLIGEHCSSPALLIGGEVAFSLSHALTFCALVALTGDACRRHLSAEAGPWCALFIATMPVAVTGALTQKSDTLFALGAIWMLDAFSSLLDDEDDPAPLYGFALAAAMTASTKYIATGYVAALVLAALVFGRRRLRATDRRALLIAGGLLLTGCLVYLRNLVIYGDPLFPLGHRWMGGPDWASHAAALRTGFAADGPFRSLSGWAENLWRVPYDFVFRMRDPTINDLPGVGVVVLPPLLLLARPVPVALKRWLLVTAAMAPLWLYLSPYVRFYPFGWLVLGVACGAAVPALGARFPQLRALVVVLALFFVAHSVAWSIRADEPLLHTTSGILGQTETLDRRSELLPTARAFAFVESRTRPDEVVLVASDGRMAYLHRPAIYADVYGYPRFLELVEGARSPAEALERARAANVRAVVVAPAFLNVLHKNFGWPRAEEHEGWRNLITALGAPAYKDRYALVWLID